ncbi:MAG TPA: hypothetical protein VGT08_13655 [Terracidiphilus sp.]|nr:hypothetical protein [Terracidiphilus sp.]
MPQPCSDDLNFHALFQQPNCGGVADDVVRYTAAVLVAKMDALAFGVALHYLVDTESRQGLSLA